MKRDVATVEQWAAEFDETPRVWWERCRAGHVPGAFRVGRRWFIDRETFWDAKLGERVHGQAS